MGYPFPPLDFPHDALEPAVSPTSLVFHHDVVHRGYHDRADALLPRLGAFSEMTVEALLANFDHLQDPLKSTVAYEAGGHANHQFFWKILKPGRLKDVPEGPLMSGIEKSFGSFEKFQAEFSQKASAFEGQGWAFLSLKALRSPQLEVVVLPENESVIPIRKPGILICDLWDHAWTQDHPDRRTWVESFWKIVNWDVCETRYLRLVAGATVV